MPMLEDSLPVPDQLLMRAQTSLAQSKVKASFVCNGGEHSPKISAVIEDELNGCTDFDMSVAFVTSSGLIALKNALDELIKRGGHGRVLTTDYLTFSSPKALRDLANMDNLDVRLYRCSGEVGFHTKGYMFDRPAPDDWHCLIGSANMTGNALSKNHEWMVRVTTNRQSTFSGQVCEAFERLWNSPNAVPVSDAIDDYEKEWRKAEQQRAKAQLAVEQEVTFTPNSMQRAFVDNVLGLFRSKEKRALLISATGTGKTYAAAFAAQALLPQRLLFVVHREQIAKQTRNTFARVLGAERTYGLLSGSNKDTDADCIFATVQTLSKDGVLTGFEPDAFDLIIVDEVHHAAASSFARILDHFKPKFLLGLTATPERTDGQNIYELFDHNIAYEIRLQTALKEDLLCPFHYFGIADVSVNGVAIEENSAFDVLTHDERVKHIMERADFFGYSGNRVRGLIFCSTIAECEKLSESMNRRGLSTLALSGTNTQDERMDAIRRLTQKDREGGLDYILTVDIFNEGVDIPEINQVILLRPTESPIVFTQQLGRGLRKYKDKEFVVVLDFIGNYKNSFLIPVALSGDRTYDKDNMRRFIQTERKLIPGASSIHFDELSRQRIFKAIDTAKTNDIQRLRMAYKALKNKLGRIPKLSDYESLGEIDVTKYFDNASLGSYDAFLRKYEPDYTVKLSAEGQEIINMLCTRLGKAKRVSEAIVLEAALKQFDGIKTRENLAHTLVDILATDYGLTPSKQHLENVFKVLTNAFTRSSKEAQQTEHCVFLKKDSDERWCISEGFALLLQKDADLKSLIYELCTFIKDRWERRYRHRYGDTDFVLGEKYAYDEVCRLLNWPKNLSGQSIGGYVYNAETKTFPVFINYRKADGAIGYEDRFVSPDSLIALSKTNRNINSVDADHIYRRTVADKDNRFFLFVRRDKKDDEGAKYFYFLGEIDAQDDPVAVTMNEKPAFEILYKLRSPVEADLYSYLTETNES